VFPIGGYGVMAAGALAAALVLAGAASLLGRRFGSRVWPVALLAWSLALVVLVTLTPTTSDPGVVSADLRLPYCSWDLGGPAPDGFWVFDGGQRALNTALFVPAGFSWALVVARARRWLLATVAGAVGLAAVSAVVERVQLELARLDRACDVTDVVDNVTGAGLGLLVGLVVGRGIVLARRGRR
jgi:hypothetical protein